MNSDSGSFFFYFPVYCMQLIYKRIASEISGIKMEKYHGFDQLFYDFLFEKIVNDGGLRMQLIASELVKELQEKFAPKDPINIFRKQYGNIYEALKAMKSKPYFVLDNMVIRMKSPAEVRALNIRPDLMKKYENKLI